MILIYLKNCINSFVLSNMPLRFLHYLSDVYRNMYSNDMLHRRSMIKLPVPHFVTFYNGLEKWIETDEVIKLSDMFELPVDKPEIEIEVRVININGDADILKKCKTLHNYMTFVNKVNEKKYSENKDIRTAVTEAVDECIASGILSDFFSEHREEVIDVSVYDYDEEGRMRVEREEGREEGRKEGLQALITTCKELGVSFEETAAKLKEKYSLGDTEVQKSMNLYWK